jgi:lipid-binding SYLF domain-containing protein
MLKQRHPILDTRIRIAALLVGALALAGTALADSKAEIDAGVTAALKQFYAQSDTNRELGNKATAMLVFPHVTKGGVGIAGAFGEGALVVHGRTVAYYKMTSASVGATLGVAQRKEVMLFMTDRARDEFIASQGWTIGADTGVAVVSKGAGGEYDTETLRKPILAFVFGEKGLIGDVSLEGTKISKILITA